MLFCAGFVRVHRFHRFHRWGRERTRRGAGAEVGRPFMARACPIGGTPNRRASPWAVLGCPLGCMAGTSPGSCTETAFGVFRFACIGSSPLWLGGFVAYPVRLFAGKTGGKKPLSRKEDPEWKGAGDSAPRCSMTVNPAVGKTSGRSPTESGRSGFCRPAGAGVP